MKYDLDIYDRGCAGAELAEAGCGLSWVADGGLWRTSELLAGYAFIHVAFDASLSALPINENQSLASHLGSPRP